MTATPQQVLWSLSEIMGKVFVQGVLDEFLSQNYGWNRNGELVVLDNGEIFDHRTNDYLGNPELIEFIEWAKEQEW